VKCELFVAWGPARRLLSPDPGDAFVGFKDAALMSSHVKMQGLVLDHMTLNLRLCGWPETAQTDADI
jgi:hypothetical protein